MRSTSTFHRWATAGGLALLIGAPLAHAEDARPAGPPHGPPPEAVAACSGKAEGDKVTVTLRDGQAVAATCRTMHDQLAAWPDRAPGDRPPPPR